MVKFKLENAMRKKDYWIACGKTLLEDNGNLAHKWEEFVIESINSFGEGILIDEMLQIMSMIKMNVPSKQIKEVLDKIESKGTVISYLSGFIHPEYLYEIEQSYPQK